MRIAYKNEDKVRASWPPSLSVHGIMLPDRSSDGRRLLPYPSLLTYVVKFWIADVSLPSASEWPRFGARFREVFAGAANDT